MTGEDDNESQQRRQVGKVRRKKMKSILPDHLDVIDEDSEEESLLEIHRSHTDNSCSRVSAASRNKSIAGDSYTTLSQKMLDTENNYKHELQIFMRTTKYVADENHISMSLCVDPNEYDDINVTTNRVRRTRSRTSIDQADLFNENFKITTGMIGESSSEATSKTIETEDCTEDGSGCSSRCSCDESSAPENENIEAIRVKECFVSIDHSSSSSSDSQVLRIEHGFNVQSIDQSELWGNASCDVSLASNYNYDEEVEDSIGEFESNINANVSIKSINSRASDCELEGKKHGMETKLKRKNNKSDRINKSDAGLKTNLGVTSIVSDGDEVRNLFVEKNSSMPTLLPLKAGDLSSQLMILSSSTFDSKHSTTSTGSQITFSEDETSFHNHADDDNYEEEIAWRIDPLESLSDWTLIVKVATSNEVVKYHVHKSVLGLGVRKSELFLNIFEKYTNTANDEKSNTTELELLKPAAMAVPMLLDYIYANKLTLTTKNVVVLRFLSQIFGTKQLFLKVMEFIQRDLNLNTIANYYVTSTQLGDQKLRNIASKHFGRNILKIHESHPMIKLMDPYYFSNILKSIAKDVSSRKKLHASLLVAEYCSLQQDSLDYGMFSMLTNEAHLQLIHYSAALNLLNLDFSYERAGKLNANPNALYVDDERSLRDRSINAIAGKWKMLCEKYPDHILSACKQLPYIIVSEIFLRSLQQTQKSKKMRRSSTSSSCSGRSGSQINESESQNNDKANFDGDSLRNRSPRINRLTTDNCSAYIMGQDPAFSQNYSNLYDEHESTISPQKKDGICAWNSCSHDIRDTTPFFSNTNCCDTNKDEGTIFCQSSTHSKVPNAGESTTHLVSHLLPDTAYLRVLCKKKDKEISRLKTELGRFQRLQNKPDGMLVKSGSKCGPTQLPEVIPTAAHGQLLLSALEKGHRYPLFYYS